MSSLCSLKLAAATVQVPFELLRAICMVESNLNPAAVHLDDGNSASHGLCQVKYETAKFMGYKGTLKGLYNPDNNALFAAKYLNYQLTRYKGNWVNAVSAYNRGTASSSNLHYVKKVFNQLKREGLNGELRYPNKEYTRRIRETSRPLKARFRH